MEQFIDWSKIGLESITAFGQKVMMQLPNIIGALFLIFLGWVIGKISAYVVSKALKAIRFDNLSKRFELDELLNQANLTLTPSQLVGRFVYWIIILLFFVTASETLGWQVVSTSISELIAYLPKLFSAIVIFVIGYYIASFIRSGIKTVLKSMSVSSGEILSSFAFYLIVVIISLTALNQAGVDTGIITSNVTLILGGLILAFAITFALSAREVMTNILSSFYSKNNFEVGQQIQVNNTSGKIIKMDGVSVTIQTQKGKVIMPSQKLITEEVTVVDDLIAS